MTILINFGGLICCGLQVFPSFCFQSDFLYRHPYVPMATIFHNRTVNLIITVISLIGLGQCCIDLTTSSIHLSDRLSVIETNASNIIMGVYSRCELLQLRDSEVSNARLPQGVWRTILSLGLEKDEFRPTHRGVRAGLKVKQKTNAPTPRMNFSSTSSCDSTCSDSYINVCQWNARSVRNKTVTCTEYLLDHNVDIMLITETWLTKEKDPVVIGELTLPGYNFINIPRPTNDDHGGIGILYRCSFKLQVIPFEFYSKTFEFVITSDRQREIYYVTVYRPPPSSENKLTTSQFLSDFDDFLLELNALSGKLILLGDFNMHVDTPNRADVRRFLSSIEEVGLHQHVIGPTHKHGHTLDLVMSRLDDNLVKDWRIGTRMSDHNAILCKVNVQRPEAQKKVTSSRNIKNIDQQAFKDHFSEKFSSLNANADDANVVTEGYENAITATLDIYAPATKRSCTNRARQPWYNSDIHVARRARCKCEKRWRKTRLEADHQLYLEELQRVNTMIDNAKKCYIKEQLCTADIKTVFRTVNGLLNNNNKTLPSHDSPQCLSNEFAQYFRDKVKKIYDGLESEQCNVDSSSISNMCDPRIVPSAMSDFDLLSEEEVLKLVKRFTAKSCLLDPIPTWYVKNNLPTFVPGITKILNVSLSHRGVS